MSINKRLVTSALTIGAAGAMLVGATFAFFSAQATSNNNVFSSGTLTLGLLNGVATGGSEFSNSVTATFGANNMKPGDCTGDATLTLKNTGTVDATHVHVGVANTNDTFAGWLRINHFTYDGGTVSVGTPDSNGNGWMDLRDFAVNGLDVPGITAGSMKQLVMDVCLDQSADNSAQNQSDTLTLTATLSQ